MCLITLDWLSFPSDSLLEGACCSLRLAGRKVTREVCASEVLVFVSAPAMFDKDLVIIVTESFLHAASFVEDIAQM